VVTAKGLSLEQRLYRDYAELYDLAEKIRTFSKEHINAEIVPLPPPDENVVLTFFVVRAHTTFCAGLELCRRGHAIAAVLLARNLVEELITLRYILDNPDAATRYAEYEHVLKYRRLHRMQLLKSPLFDPLRNGWLQGAQKINEEYERVKNTYSLDFQARFWAGKGLTIERMAEKDAKSKDLYNYYYAALSSFVHGTVETSSYFMELTDDDGVLFYPGATEKLQPEVLRILLTVFPLFWDELSIRIGKPTWVEVCETVKNDYFEHFSRNPAKAAETPPSA